MAPARGPVPTRSRRGSLGLYAQREPGPGGLELLSAPGVICVCTSSPSSAASGGWGGRRWTGGGWLCAGTPGGAESAWQVAPQGGCLVLVNFLSAVSGDARRDIAHQHRVIYSATIVSFLSQAYYCGHTVADNAWCRSDLCPNAVRVTMRRHMSLVLTMIVIAFAGFC